MDSSDTSSSDDSIFEKLDPPRLRPRVGLVQPPISLRPQQAQSYSYAQAAKFAVDKPGTRCSKRTSAMRENLTLPNWWPSYAVITSGPVKPPVMNSCRHQIVRTFLKEQLNSSQPLKYGPVGGVKWQEEIVQRLKRLRGSSGNILGRDVLYWIRTSDLIDLFRRICLKPQERGTGNGQREASSSTTSSGSSTLRPSKKAPAAPVETPRNNQPIAGPSQNLLSLSSPQVTRPVKRSLVAADNDETEWPTLLASMNKTRSRASRTAILPRVVADEPTIRVPNKSAPTIVKATLLPTASAPQNQPGPGDGVPAQEPHTLTLDNGSLVFQVPADVVPGTFYMLTPTAYSVTAYNPIILPPAVDLRMNANHEVNQEDHAGQDQVPAQANKAARQAPQDKSPEVPTKRRRVI